MLSLFIFGFISAFAEINLSMITSRAALRSYALSEASEINGGLYLYSGGTSGYDYRVWSGQKTSVEIIEEAKLLNLTVETVDTTDTVGCYISVNNTDGDTLFYGYTNDKPVKVNDKWILPSTMGNIVFNMSNIPIKLAKQVSSAYILSRDEYGNTQWSELYTNGDKIWFSEASAGLENSYIRVSYSDGTVESYSIATGNFLPTINLGLSVTPVFSDVSTFKDVSLVTLVVKSTRGKGIIPTIELVNTVSSKIKFDIQTSEGKRPIRYWYRSAQIGDWSAIDVTASTIYPIEIGLPKGTVYIVPEWNPIDFDEVSQPVATGGG